MKLSLVLLSACLVGVAPYTIPSKFTWNPLASALNTVSSLTNTATNIVSTGVAAATNAAAAATNVVSTGLAATNNPAAVAAANALNTGVAAATSAANGAVSAASNAVNGAVSAATSAANGAVSAATNAANGAVSTGVAAATNAANGAISTGLAVVPTPQIVTYLLTLRNLMPTVEQTQAFLSALNAIRVNMPDLSVLLSAFRSVLGRSAEIGLSAALSAELTKAAAVLEALQRLEGLGIAMLARLRAVVPGLDTAAVARTATRAIAEGDAIAVNQAMAAALSLPTMGTTFAAQVLTSKVNGLGDIGKLAVSMGDRSVQAFAGLGAIGTQMVSDIGKEAVGGISGMASLGLGTATGLAKDALGMLTGLGKVLIPAGPLLNGAAALGNNVVDNMNGLGTSAINNFNNFGNAKLDAINSVSRWWNGLVGTVSQDAKGFYTNEVDFITNQLNGGIATSLKAILASLNSQ